MITFPDLAVRDVLLDVLASLREDSEPLDEAFVLRPENERLEIREYFSTTAIPCQLGFPREAAQLPGYFVVVGHANEVIEPLGGAIEVDTDMGVNVKDLIGTLMETTVQVMCWADNAELTAWMQHVAHWGLLGSRRTLGAMGLSEQRCQVSDFMPMPEWFPTIAFRRDLALISKHFVSVAVYTPKVRTIEVTAVPFSAYTIKLATRKPYGG